MKNEDLKEYISITYTPESSEIITQGFEVLESMIAEYDYTQITNLILTRDEIPSADTSDLIVELLKRDLNRIASMHGIIFEDPVDLEVLVNLGIALTSIIDSDLKDDILIAIEGQDDKLIQVASLVNYFTPIDEYEYIGNIKSVISSVWLKLKESLSSKESSYSEVNDLTDMKELVKIYGSKDLLGPILIEGGVIWGLPISNYITMASPMMLDWEDEVPEQIAPNLLSLALLVADDSDLWLSFVEEGLGHFNVSLQTQSEILIITRRLIEEIVSEEQTDE